MLAMGPASLHASDLPSGDAPVDLAADELIYAQDGNVVTATGNVEITQAGYVLLADQVEYHQDADRMLAVGNVSLLQLGGNVLFADEIELSDQMRNGFIKSVRLLLSDQSRMAAREGERRNGQVMELHKVLYSPCRICDDEPEKAPLWQIKAGQVTHDQEKKTISYRNAFLELWGVPVAYSPYFSHPDPSVKRKSGFI